MTAPSKKLQAEWRRKLKDAGFEDLEQPNNPDGFLSRRGASRLVIPPVALGFAQDAEEGCGEADASIEGTEEYYAAVRGLLETARWPQPINRLVVQYHAEGIGMQEIASRTGVPLRKTIKIIRRAQQRAGLRVNDNNLLRVTARQTVQRMSLKEALCFARKFTLLTDRGSACR